jgi:MFS family permease
LRRGRLDPLLSHQGAVTLLHYAPQFFLAPLTGLAADEALGATRATVLTLAAAAASLAVALQAAAAARRNVPLTLALVALQCSATAFYDPALTALVPTLVPPGDLRAATTLLAVAWSTMTAAGAAAGGAALSALGPGPCFAVDAASYLVAAAAAASLRDGASRGGKARRSDAGDAEAGVELKPAPRSPARPTPQRSPQRRTAASALATAASDAAAGARHCAAHPSVAAYALLKASGCLVWGAADIVNVRVGDDPSLTWRDADTTAGAVFAAVGVGCFAGSAAANTLAAFDPPSLLRACVAAFGCLALGYAALAAATTLPAVLAASALRAAGSAVVWTYSTLLLQVTVPATLLGRVLAVEGAAYTVARVGAVAAGAAIDAGGLSLRASAAGMACVGTVVAVGWAAYAARREAGAAAVVGD